MRIFAAGDFHGVVPKKFRKYAKGCDLMLCTGDMANRDEERRLIFKYWKESEQGLLLDLFIPPKKYQKLILGGINSMKPVVREIDGYGIRVFTTNGNGDFEKVKIKHKTKRVKLSKFVSFEELVEQSRHIEFIRCGIKNLSDEYQLVAYGNAYIDPRKEKKLLRKLFSKIDKKRKQIFLTHEPPFRTKLDIAGYGPSKGKHLGSRAISWAIKEYKPVLHISGHIHESQGFAKLGRTVCVNTGYGRKGEAAVIELNKKIKIKLLK